MTESSCVMKVSVRLASAGGVAGQSAGSPYGDMPGHVCLAAVGDTATVSRTIENGGTDRPRNMNLFARQLLALFEETLRAQPEEAPPA